jgi:hypothetical protein
VAPPGWHDDQQRAETMAAAVAARRGEALSIPGQGSGPGSIPRHTSLLPRPMRPRARGRVRLTTGRRRPEPSAPREASARAELLESGWLGRAAGAAGGGRRRADRARPIARHTPRGSASRENGKFFGAAGRRRHLRRGDSACPRSQTMGALGEQPRGAPRRPSAARAAGPRAPRTSVRQEVSVAGRAGPPGPTQAARRSPLVAPHCADAPWPQRPHWDPVRPYAPPRLDRLQILNSFL